MQMQNISGYWKEILKMFDNSYFKEEKEKEFDLEEVLENILSRYDEILEKDYYVSPFSDTLY